MCFLKLQRQGAQWTVYSTCVFNSSNFDSCCERLCEGIGPTLRKDDSCLQSFVGSYFTWITYIIYEVLVLRHGSQCLAACYRCLELWVWTRMDGPSMPIYIWMDRHRLWVARQAALAAEPMTARWPRCSIVRTCPGPRSTRTGTVSQPGQANNCRL